DLARLLVEATHLQSLDQLDVSKCGLGDKGYAVLASCAHLGRVGRLDIGDNEATAAGLAALVASPHLNRMRQMVIGSYYNQAAWDQKQALIERYGDGVV